MESFELLQVDQGWAGNCLECRWRGHVKSSSIEARDDVSRHLLTRHLIDVDTLTT